MWNQGVQRPGGLTSSATNESKDEINEHEMLSSIETSRLQPESWLRQEQPCQQPTPINTLVSFGREVASKNSEYMHGSSHNQQLFFENFVASQLQNLDEQENVNHFVGSHHSTDMMAALMPTPLPEIASPSVHAGPNEDSLELGFTLEQLEQLVTQSELQSYSSKIHNVPRYDGQVTAAHTQLHNEPQSKQTTLQTALASEKFDQAHVDQRHLLQKMFDQQIFELTQSSVPTYPQHLLQPSTASPPQSYPQHQKHKGQYQQITTSPKLSDQSNSERDGSSEATYSSKYMTTTQTPAVAASLSNLSSDTATEAPAATTKTRAVRTQPQHHQWPPWVFSHPTSADILSSSSLLQKKNVVSGKSSIWKDADRPKRPLTAYNIFFQHERAKMLGEESIFKELTQNDHEQSERSGAKGAVEIEKKQSLEERHSLSNTSNDDAVADMKQLSTVIKKEGFKALPTNKVGFQEMARTKKRKSQER